MKDRRKSVDNYGKSVEQTIMSYIMNNGHNPTDLDSLTVEYSGDTVVCNIKQMKTNGGLYMSECSANGKEVLDSKNEDGYYHYNKKDQTNEDYVKIYGDALNAASIAYYNSHSKTPVSDYKALDVGYNERKKVSCNVRINPDGTTSKV